MKVLLGSTSSIKISAVKEVLCNDDIEFLTQDMSLLKTTEQPIGEKIIKDCLHKRLQYLTKDADMNIVVESGIVEENGQFFDQVFTIITTNENDEIIVHAGEKFQIEKKIAMKTIEYNGEKTWGQILAENKDDMGTNPKDPHSTVSNGKLTRHSQLVRSIRKAYVEKNFIPDSVENFPKKGVTFYSLEPILSNGIINKNLYIDIVERVLKGVSFDLVAGIETRGFDIAASIAIISGKGFIRIRKKGKLPPIHPLVSSTYKKEYGEDVVEMHQAYKGARILLVDDILATGGTMKAAETLIKKAGGIVAGQFVLIKLKEFINNDEIDNVSCYKIL